MSATTARAPRAFDQYPVSLQQAADALWGGDFWGREVINPEPPLRFKRPAKPVSANDPSGSSA